MSRFFSRFMMLAGALLVFAGCDEAKQDAPANDTLVIGYENFAPYLYAGSGGKPTGFDFDLANEVARRNGWKTEFRVIPWQDKEELLDAGEIDCLWGGMKLTAQRKDSFLCCAPYLLSAEVVVATRASCIQSPADLAGKTLAVQRTTPDFREFTDGSQKHLGSKLKKMVMVDDFSDICELLETGKVDAVATDYLVASHLWRNNPEIVILPKSIIDTWNVIGF
ncbi:MAG: substrate-binding periplasmic protein, partial [Victivallaceae bacterium]